MLRLLQRSGKLSEKGLEDGELAVICPSCPRPGVNIPINWKDDPLRYAFRRNAYCFFKGSANFDNFRRLKYGLFFSGDGNFKLQRRLKAFSNTSQESMLGDGAFWALRKLFSSYAAAMEALPEEQVCAVYSYLC